MTVAAYKASLVLSEGLVFGLVALGIYVLFQWLRFPDLTPDGSFVLGAVAYVTAATAGHPMAVAVASAPLAGGLAGCCTALLHRLVGTPAVVAGMLVSSAAYSVAWLALGKPNQFLDPSLTFVGERSGEAAAWRLLVWLAAFTTAVVVFLAVLVNTVWGLRLRAIGENDGLARELGLSPTLYGLTGLVLGNCIVGLAGALAAQRSYSADINMGFGITITGLAGMILGSLLVGRRRRWWLVLTAVVAGAILYKAILFLAIEVGLPAETFRLISAVFLLTLFVAVRSPAFNVLRNLKWN